MDLSSLLSQILPPLLAGANPVWVAIIGLVVMLLQSGALRLPGQSSLGQIINTILALFSKKPAPAPSPTDPTPSPLPPTPANPTNPSGHPLLDLLLSIFGRKISDALANARPDEQHKVIAEWLDKIK